jgi:methyl-accepting chemotaxis protein
MKEMTKAGMETSKIVKSIDEIAFQTNLLSLNAAVEAARAGESGSGFAVVAEEVRNLAMRAAEAAKNSSRLIEETVQNIEDGFSKLQQSNRDFDQLLSKIEETSQLFTQIADSANEQSVGIEQINQSISHIERILLENSGGIHSPGNNGSGEIPKPKSLPQPWQEKKPDWKQLRFAR